MRGKAQKVKKKGKTNKQITTNNKTNKQQQQKPLPKK
jgi:hypothetical protein